MFVYCLYGKTTLFARICAGKDSGHGKFIIKRVNTDMKSAICGIGRYKFTIRTYSGIHTIYIPIYIIFLGIIFFGKYILRFICYFFT